MSTAPVAPAMALSAHTLPDAPHWRFALSCYSRAGVADACLTLQDTLGLDVNVLLLSVYAAQELGRPPTHDEVADADGRVAAWRHDVVQPLRAVRRRLKQGPAPAPDAATQALRGRLQFVEIEAEYVQQSVLAQWVAGLSAQATGPDAARPWSVPEARREAVQRVVAFYAGRALVQGDDGWPPLVQLLGALAGHAST